MGENELGPVLAELDESIVKKEFGVELQRLLHVFGYDAFRLSIQGHSRDARNLEGFS